MRARSTIGNLSDLPDSHKPLGDPVKTACRLVGVGNTTMWALIKAGRVKSVRVGRRRVVIFSSLESLLNSDAEVAS
jgi:excisionase family DNA binding protein